MKNLTFEGVQIISWASRGRGVRFLNREKYPWALMRRTRVPNFIPIWRWEKSEKSGEPKTGGWVLRAPRGRGFRFQNQEKYPWAILRRTRRYTKFYPNRTMEKGWKIGGTQNRGEEEDTRSRCQICRFQTVITFFLREISTRGLKYVLLVYWISHRIRNLSNLE